MFYGKDRGWWMNYVNPDFSTGTLYWKVRSSNDFLSSDKHRICKSWNTQFSGNAVGTKSTSKGKVYLKSKIQDIKFPVHGLIYFLYHGHFDHNLVINHINGNTLDNRPDNLELVTQAENVISRVSIRKDNTSGVKGVSWSKRHNMYMVRLQIRGKRIFGGMFKDLESASEAYHKLAVMHHRHVPPQ